MHEFPEVQAMVRNACASARGKKVRRLTIAVGEASGHDAHHISEHFVEASRATMAEGAELRFVSERLAARCTNCGRSYESAAGTFSCTDCGGMELTITSGMNVRLLGIET